MPLDEERIRKLLRSVIGTVKKNLSKFSVDTVINKRHVTEFEYTEKGITNFNWQIDALTRPSFESAFIKILPLIERTKEYQELQSLSAIEPILFQQFIGRIIRNLIENNRTIDFNKLIKIYIKDLKGEPIKSGAIVALNGILLEPDEIKINNSIKIRKPTKEDFENEFQFFYDLENPLIQEFPTAFIEIFKNTRNMREIHDQVHKSIIILRLFNQGGVKDISTRILSESYSLSLKGTLRSFDGNIFPNCYYLSNDEAIKLKKFWNWITPFITDSFIYGNADKLNYELIAFKRYSDSLLQKGTFESNIASAIMGLESIFLLENEKTELSYRLAIRTARFLSNYCDDPIEIKNDVKTAYDIRSIYLHGGQLGTKKQNKLKEAYDGDINSLLTNIQRYLGFSIIFLITSHLTKKELIKIIDDSLLDDKANLIIKESIRDSKKFCK